MTLEPVHMKEISEIASEIEYADTEKEPQDISDLFKLLSELKQDGKVFLKAVGKLSRSVVDMRRMSQAEDGFEITYASDSGSTNPILFERGLVLDICHSVIASSPTDLNLHRKRTIVCTGFSAGKKTKLPENENWKSFDDGFGKSKMIQIDPAYLKIRVGRMVHDYSIYASESEHILRLQPEMNLNGFFIMDGPIYPKQLMYWMGTNSEKVLIRHDRNAKKILQNYIDIMDFHLENKMPVIGFVKNPAETQIIQLLKEKAKGEKIFADFSWATDTQFFKSILNPESEFKDKKADAAGGFKKTNRFKITCTNWFWQPNQFYDDDIKTNSPLIEDSVRGKYPDEDYTPAFFMVRVPFENNNIVFKIESLYGLIKDEETRHQMTRKVLYELSVGKIPETLLKADSIAKISMDEKREIRNMFTQEAVEKTYNEMRWGDLDEF
jgi:NurA domain.